MEDANKVSTTLINRVFAAMLMSFSLNKHHFGGQVVAFARQKHVNFMLNSMLLLANRMLAGR